MTRTVLAAAIVTAFTIGTAEADKSGAQPFRNQVDQYAMVKVVNETDLVLNFDYRFGNGPWQSISLSPGQWQGLYAGFTAPGSYRHDTIEFRFDDDLRYGHDFWQSLVPYVTYTSTIDYSQAFEYHLAYTSSSRQFLEMHPAR